jgi:hypothetical protein
MPATRGSRALTGWRTSCLALLAGGVFVTVAGPGCMREGSSGEKRWDPGSVFSGGGAKPSGEEWTILCIESREANRARTVELLLGALRQVNGIDARKARASNDEGVSRIWYGSYYRKVDAQTQRESFGPQAQQDLQLIRSLATGSAYPFAAARFVPVPTPDPGKPEWDVRRCPGAYTLHIGVFYDTPTFTQHKQAAVEWVEQLRAEGHEAWYFHGVGRSSVMVGSFSPQDVTRDSKPPGQVGVQTPAHYSERVQLLRKQEQFKYNLENGHKVKRRIATLDGPREVYQESFMIPVPKAGQVDRPPTEPDDMEKG